MKRKDPLQLFKFRFSKLSCLCNFFPSLVHWPLLGIFENKTSYRNMTESAKFKYTYF